VPLFSRYQHALGRHRLGPGGVELLRTGIPGEDAGAEGESLDRDGEGGGERGGDPGRGGFEEGG